MLRLVLALCLPLALAFAAHAEEPLPQPIQKTEEVLKLREEDGKKVLKLAGDRRDIPVEELIRLWCEHEKVNVMYQPTQLAGFKVSVMAPSSGTEVPADKLSQLVSDALEQFRLVVIEISENRYSIVQAAEAITHAPVVDVATARKTPGWKWITVQMPIRHGDANSMRAVLYNVMSRAGGSLNPNIIPPALIICDRADRLQRMINAVEALEAEGARRTARTYTLPAGIDAASAAAGFATIIGERYNLPTPPAAAVSETMVVVRATPEKLLLCDELFRQLVAKAEAVTARSKITARRYDVGRASEKFVESLEKLFMNQIAVAVVPGTDVIIVRANAATHEEVEAALELMK